MADVEIDIGSDGSKIENSKISLSDIASERQSHLTETIAKIELRVSKIEELLGGYLGLPGLTQEFKEMKMEIMEVKKELRRNYVPPSQYLFLSLSVGCLLLSVIVAVFGLWR